MAKFWIMVATAIIAGLLLPSPKMFAQSLPKAPEWKAPEWTAEDYRRETEYWDNQARILKKLGKKIVFINGKETLVDDGSKPLPTIESLTKERDAALVELERERKRADSLAAEVERLKAIIR